MAKIREHIANTSLVFLCIVPYIRIPNHNVSIYLDNVVKGRSARVYIFLHKGLDTL